MHGQKVPLLLSTGGLVGLVGLVGPCALQEKQAEFLSPVRPMRKLRH